jgi:hypothetical protein
MENEFDDLPEVNEVSEGMNEFLNDRFGKAEITQTDDPESIEAYLNDKYPVQGAIEPELTVPERFAQLKKRR